MKFQDLIASNALMVNFGAVLLAQWIRLARVDMFGTQI
jgi:hypothetical protein